MGSGCPIGARGPRTGFEVSEMGLGSSVSYRSKGWGPSTGFGGLRNGAGVLGVL